MLHGTGTERLGLRWSGDEGMLHGTGTGQAGTEMVWG